ALRADEAAARFADRPAVAPDRLPAEERLRDPAAQAAADERAVPVAVAEILVAELVLRAEVDEHEVGVAAGLDAALSRQPEPARGRAGDEASDVRRPEPARRRRGRERGEQGLAAGDAAPDGERVLVLLQRARRGGVVAGDEVDTTGRQLRPQLLDLGPRAQRRRALRHRAERLEVVLV